MNNTTTREHKHRTKQKPKTNEQAKTQNEPTHLKTPKSNGIHIKQRKMHNKQNTNNAQNTSNKKQRTQNTQYK